MSLCSPQIELCVINNQQVLGTPNWSPAVRVHSGSEPPVVRASYPEELDHVNIHTRDPAHNYCPVAVRLL